MLSTIHRPHRLELPGSSAGRGGGNLPERPPCVGRRAHWLDLHTDPIGSETPPRQSAAAGRGGSRRDDQDGRRQPLPRVTLGASPGHSFDHMCIALDTGAERALFSGDLLHHPVRPPDRNGTPGFCGVPARPAPRRSAPFIYAGDDTIFTAHFAPGSAGRVRAESPAVDWHAFSDRHEGRRDEIPISLSAPFPAAISRLRLQPARPRRRRL